MNPDTLKTIRRLRRKPLYLGLCTAIDFLRWQATRP